MKKTFKKTSAFVCAMAVIAAPMTFSSFVANAEGEPVTSDYTLTIPATLAVENSGWNATDGISATGTLATGKKLVVTASSDDEFALVNQTDNTQKVAYKLAESGDANSTYANATEKTSWEFTALSETAATQPMGIVVEDYSSKPAGDYSDTVTFTAKVEDAKPEYYDKLTKINDDFMEQVMKLKSLGRGRESYNSSLTAAQAYALATYQAAIDGKPVYVIMSSQNYGYEIHYALSTDAAATEHTADLYDICNESNPVRMYYVAQ